jgi:hypothetical protein
MAPTDEGAARWRHLLLVAAAVNMVVTLVI